MLVLLIEEMASWDMMYVPSRGRAIAQAVSRWLPTAAAQIRARVWSCGICGGQSGVGAGFLRILRFPLPIFIPPIAPQSPSYIIWGLYNRPEMAAVPSGLSPTPQNKKKYVPSIMKISIGSQAVLRFRFRNQRDCNVGITDGRDFRNTPLKWTQMA
jgi:hypothetical protein